MKTFICELAKQAKKKKEYKANLIISIPKTAKYIDDVYNNGKMFLIYVTPCGVYYARENKLYNEL